MQGLNKLYPEILSPASLPPSLLLLPSLFICSQPVFQSSFFIPPTRLHRPRANLFPFFYSSLSPFSSPCSTTHSLPASLQPHPQASENKLSLCLPTVQLLCKTAGATWRSLKVHVPRSATGAAVVLHRAARRLLLGLLHFSPSQPSGQDRIVHHSYKKMKPISITSV